MDVRKISNRIGYATEFVTTRRNRRNDCREHTWWNEGDDGADGLDAAHPTNGIDKSGLGGRRLGALGT